jgi:hypothetical protein
VARELIPAEEILAVLVETPKRLQALTGGVGEAQLATAPAPGAWSLVEQLAHLRSCGDVWGDAIATILAEDHPTIRAINPTTWIDRTDYCDLEFGPSFRAFVEQREGLCTLLQQLEPEAWARGATVVGGGTPRELTLHRYASRMARHERSHWRQLEKTLKSVLRPPTT